MLSNQAAGLFSTAVPQGSQHKGPMFTVALIVKAESIRMFNKIAQIFTKNFASPDVRLELTALGLKVPRANPTTD